MNIKSATPDDAEAILNIYAPYITDTCVSFETEVPTITGFAERISNIIKTYPYLVCEIDGNIVGYAYAARHRERAAYKYSADVSIYIKPEYHHRGIGKALYIKLFELLREREIYTAFAAITLPNESSVGLHKTLGFTEIGVYHNVGYKFGKWLDLIWLEKPLLDYTQISDI
jgi:Sortase and related acyltransferases